MNRKCARPFSHWDYWMKQMHGNYKGSKTKLIFSTPTLFKNVPMRLPQNELFCTQIFKRQKLLASECFAHKPQASSDWELRPQTQVCGPNFTLEEHFCLFVFTLDLSLINRTRSHSIRTCTSDFQFWWTRTRNLRTLTRESGNSHNTAIYVKLA